MHTKQRMGVLVADPIERLTHDQIRLVDRTSREILRNPGVVCYNDQAVETFVRAGARVIKTDGEWSVRIPDRLIEEATRTAPSTVTLGARDPENRLVLDALEPRARFVSGSETNQWVDVDFAEAPSGNGHGPTLVPRFSPRPGTIADLATAAHLSEHLEHLDAFIRCVNIQDAEVTAENKDVNKFFASLDNTTKHVQAGLTDLDALDDVLRMAEIIAGGPEAFRENPIVSFIACLVKSPLQMVDDTTSRTIEFARRGVPQVVSSSPMGGATAPFDEFGMVAQINAEILAGLVVTQLVAPGAPVLYGSVPVRTRLDNLNDMYGAPEFVHYNIACAQMARYYSLPCYSTAGVGDAPYPGIQATAEKMLTLATVPLAGPQYVHYAFGLLDRTNSFCPEQAVLDNAHLGLVKHLAAATTVCEERQAEVLGTVREVMASRHRVFMYHLPLPTEDDVYVRFPLEHAEGGALRAAHEEYERILSLPRRTLPRDVREQVAREIPGLLPQAVDAEVA